jgi:hypothetical protein
MSTEKTETVDNVQVEEVNVSEKVVDEKEFEIVDQDENKPTIDDKEDGDDGSDNNEESDSDDGEDDEECESDDDEECDSDDDGSDDEDDVAYVLMVNDDCLKWSDDYDNLCDYRDHLVKKMVADYGMIGKIYVSHGNGGDVTLSYFQNQLIWQVERIIATFSIYEVDKI